MTKKGKSFKKLKSLKKLKIRGGGGNVAVDTLVAQPANVAGEVTKQLNGWKLMDFFKLPFKIIFWILFGCLLFVVGWFCFLIDSSLRAFHEVMKAFTKIPALDLGKDIKKGMKDIPKGFGWVKKMAQPLTKMPKIDIGGEIKKGTKDIPKDLVELIKRDFH